MKIEAIILYILQVLFLLLESYVAYLVLQYLKRKSLGMQTILDKVVKDTILSVLFDQILRVLVMGLIVEFTIPLSENTAFIIMTLIHFFSVLRVWYIFSVIVVRYILVFYHTYLNIFDEKVTRRIIRCFVGIFSAIIVLLDSRNNSKYYLLIGNVSLDLKSLVKTGSKNFIILGFIVFTALIISQYQIEKFKKSVDSQSFDNLETIEEGQGAKRCMNQMHFNPYRIEIMTGFLLGLLNGFFQILLYSWHDLYVNRLRKTLLMEVSTIIVAFMFVFKNEKIHSFIKHQILSQLFCQSSEDIYIQNNDNSNVYTIYKPKSYEANDYFNFDKTEQEIVSQHDNNQCKPPQSSNVHELSKIIFVKEMESYSHKNDEASSVPINEEPLPGCSHW